MSIEVMKLALEALEMVKANADDWQQRTGKEIKGWMQPVNNSITALRQAIEQAQESVGRFSKFTDGVWKEVTATSAGQPLYAAPPQRQWVDLTDDEMLMIYGQKHEGKKYNLGRMVQQALKEKNGF